jgi:hypothetical protein
MSADLNEENWMIEQNLICSPHCCFEYLFWNVFDGFTVLWQCTTRFVLEFYEMSLVA